MPQLRSRIAADGKVAAEGNVLAGLAILDGASSGVRRSHGLGIVGEAEDVDLELGEGVPEGGLDERLEGRELDDRHRDVVPAHKGSGAVVKARRSRET